MLLKKYNTFLSIEIKLPSKYPADTDYDKIKLIDSIFSSYLYQIWTSLWSVTRIDRFIHMSLFYGQSMSYTGCSMLLTLEIFSGIVWIAAR